jgi:hypothetical protein
MDPNATLRTLRDTIERWRLGRESTAQAMESVADSFGALDEWLARGGFPPAAWSHLAPNFKAGDVVRNRYTLATFNVTPDNAKHFIAAHVYYELVADND